jgi:hypothetical protein
MTHDETRIRVIQHIDNDDFTPTLDPAFVVLGMIDEYMGRRAIEGGTIVERFYPDERPVAGLFANYLLQYAARIGIDSPEIFVTHAETGHLHVESRRMNDQVNALYRFEYADDQVITMLDGQRLHCAHVALSIEDFPKKRSMLYEPEAMNARYSYLHGVLLRYGREDGAIHIANASEKVKLLQQVLADLDVLWISHRYSVDGAPCCHQVSFEPRPRLVSFLDRARTERAEAFASAKNSI